MYPFVSIHLLLLHLEYKEKSMHKQETFFRNTNRNLTDVFLIFTDYSFRT